MVPPVAVRILHRDPGTSAGPLERRLAELRRRAAERTRVAFEQLGADASIERQPAGDRPFGDRLRGLVAPLPPHAGLVVLGSGAAAPARATDLAPFVATATSSGHAALANNRYSADIVAIARAGVLRDAPDLPNDNALPRWLEEVAGYRVDDLRSRWRLQVDLDTPLDGVLLGWHVDGADAVGDVLARIRQVAADARCELLVAGRTSASSLRWLEGSTRSRIRALVEERGLRTSRAGQRPPASVLGMLMEREGIADAIADLARLADAALIDSRVLLAHRLGPDERAWPTAEDRFASDLLLADRIADPWLRQLTEAVRDSPIPIVLGGHTLVGPGIRLALRGRR
jgi:hypothetical protein